MMMISWSVLLKRSGIHVCGEVFSFYPVWKNTRARARDFHGARNEMIARQGDLPSYAECGYYYRYVYSIRTRNVGSALTPARVDEDRQWSDDVASEASGAIFALYVLETDGRCRSIDRPTSNFRFRHTRSTVPISGESAGPRGEKRRNGCLCALHIFFLPRCRLYCLSAGRIIHGPSHVDDVWEHVCCGGSF